MGKWQEICHFLANFLPFTLEGGFYFVIMKRKGLFEGP
jgi:hypothetical protein